jgi:hypothetical protein
LSSFGGVALMAATSMKHDPLLEKAVALGKAL